MSKQFKKFLHHAPEAAAGAAKRAWRATTILFAYRTNREWFQLSRQPALPLLMLLALFLATVILAAVHQGSGVTVGDYSVVAVQAMLGLSSPNKFLYSTREAKTALGCGTSKFYALLNSGALEAKRFGSRTYITAASLEAFIASLPAVQTPTMAKTAHERWSGSSQPVTVPKGGAPDRRSTGGDPRANLQDEAE